MILAITQTVGPIASADSGPPINGHDLKGSARPTTERGKVVISALGHIGATTKAEGEAIGHKSIGFKSVLEMTLTPELCSGLKEHAPALAVAFDAVRSLEAIQLVTPWWDMEVVQVAGLDSDDPVVAVPVMRYPRWVDELPAAVEAFAADGYDDERAQ